MAKGYVSEQMNVDTAFLNSNLKEKVHREVPQGISSPKGMVCKLKNPVMVLSKERVHDTKLFMHCL